jgi:hypothetical protein
MLGAHKKSPCLSTGLFTQAYMSRLWQGTADFTKCVADFRSQQAHDSDYDDSDEGEDNRIFNEALAFFLWSE